MDPRMYPLATFLRELRQDWQVHPIQVALAELKHLPYEQVAVAAVRAAVDPAVTHPRGIRKSAEAESSRRSRPGPPRLCRDCGRPHDPARPLEHVAPPDPEVFRRGADRAREALRAGTASAYLPEADTEPEQDQLPLDSERDHAQRAAGDR